VRVVSEIALHFELGFVYLAQFIKTRLEYKADFLLGLFTGLLMHGVTLVFIDVLFAEKAMTLNGWTKAEVFFIYGFSIFPLNLFFAFFSNLYMVSGYYIIEGNFDRILLRPLNTLFQILLERVRVESLIGLLVGGAIMAVASRQMQLEWGLRQFLLLGGLTFCGLFIYAGVFTALASLSFWWPDRMGLMPPVYNMIAFGKYPVTIYNPLLQFVLKWIIPFAFVAFFPATEFLNREAFRFYVWMTPVVSLVTACVGFGLWRLGVRRYESTGS
jgi:ABC-2 type transport system permease protein